MSESSSERLRPYSPPLDTGLDIAYEDAYLVAVNKPAGLLSVPGRGAELQDCLLSRVLNRWSQARVVHRLDEATSGLILFALNPETQRLLSQMFANRAIHKTYEALVHGNPSSFQGWIDAPLITDWPARPRQKIDFLHGKTARTHYQQILPTHNQRQTQLLSNLELLPHSRIELKPETGRSHQLRVHLAHIQCPIIGDPLYSKHEVSTPRMFLHATRLQFKHPHDAQREISIVSEAPF